MKNKKRKIAIISRESDDKTLDVATLEEELLRRGCDVRVLSRLLTKNDPIKALGYIGQVIRQEAAILAADVVVLDTYCIPASMLPHRKGTKVVQIWHALAAVKKFGWQSVGKEGGSSERIAKVMRMHRGYDYVVCASDATAAHFCEAFDVSRDRIAKYGLPRIDYVKSIAAGDRREDMRRRIFTKYPELRDTREDRESAQRSDQMHNRSGQDPGEASAYTGPAQRLQSPRAAKKTILYAPTFRPGKAVDVQSLADSIDPERFNLVVKLHPLYRQPQTVRDDTSGSDGSVEERCRPVCGTGNSELPAGVAANAGEPSVGAAANAGTASGIRAEGAVIFDEEFSSYDWLAAADIIVSDYSAFVVESTLADKPLFIYAYDLDEYEAKTGLNMNFEEEAIAPYVFSDAASLAQAIDKPYDTEALRAFRDKYIDVPTENSTAGLADFIEKLAADGEIQERT